MNEKNTNEINDLEAVNAEEIKGGPRLTIKKIGGGLTEEGLPDLEPTGDVVGGRCGKDGGLCLDGQR